MSNKFSIYSLFSSTSKPLYTTKFFQKTCALLANFSLFLHIFLPALTAIPAFAEEPVPTPTPTSIVENIPTPEPIAEPTIEPTVIPTAIPTLEPTAEPTAIPTEIIEPTAIPTLEPTVVPTITETPTITPEPTIEPTVTPEVTQTPTAATPENNNQESNNSPDNSSTPSTSPTETPTPTVTPDPVCTPVPSFDASSEVMGEISTQVIETNVCRPDSLNSCLITDKADYSPTEVAIITGYGFSPNVEYTLYISSDNLNVNYKITTDMFGGFTYSYQLDGTYRPNYTVVIKDITDTQTALTTFTDSMTANSPSVASGWENPNNSKISDDVYTDGPSLGHTVMGFGFNIPENATIDGVEVRVERKFSRTTKYGHIYDQTAGLVLNGVPMWELSSTYPDYNRAVIWTEWARLSEEIKVFGSPTDKWGKSDLSPADVNNPNFGFNIWAMKQGSGTNIAKIDHISITVYFTEAPVCGDGKIESGEACDDGNKLNSDGCNSSCQTENKWVCLGEPSVCTEDKIDWCHCEPNGNCQTLNLPPSALQNAGHMNASGNPLHAGDYFGACVASCADTDSDGVCDSQDNCPTVSNLNQADIDSDDIGDVCDSQICGNYELESPEQCDDGNSVNTDACSNSCTFTKGHLIVQKTTFPTNDPTVFTILVSSSDGGIITGSGTGTITDTLDKNYEVTAGTYSVTEDVPGGWGETSNPCLNGVTVAAGETITCVIENKKLPVLTVEKVLVGDATPYTNFSFKVDGGTAIPFESDGNNQIYVVPGQTYNITETDPGLNYNVTYSVGCLGILTYTQSATCTITNTQKGSISGYKWDDADGSAATFIDRVAVPNWSVELWKDGVQQNITSTDLSGKYEFTNLLPGAYQVKETISGDWFNVDVTTLNITLDAGENDSGNNFVNAQYTTVTVYKNVDTNGDGIIDITNSSDWTWDITGKENNQTGITVSVLRPGAYTISEDQQTGYNVTSLICNNGIASPTQDYGAVTSQNITLTSGQDLVCTFTNTRNTGTLSVQKIVNVADDLADWEFKLDNGSWIHASDSGLVDFGVVTTGNHTITEKTQTGYYLHSVTGCTPIVANNNSATAIVTVGQQTTCTFNNYAIPVYTGTNDCQTDAPVKKLVNSYTIGSQDADGETLTGLAAGNYLFEAIGSFSPTSASGYVADAAYTTINGTLSSQYGIHGVAPDYGAHALLSNLGSGVGIVDWGSYNSGHKYSIYTASPANPQFVIGDRWSNWYGTSFDNQSGMSDNNGALTLNVYKCTANPQIVIEKSGPEFAPSNSPITYNYQITNPGDVPLTDVSVTDNKCSSVSYLSGDTNTDGKLDITETWQYRCVYTPNWSFNTNLTNTATVTAKFNDQNLTSSDTFSLSSFILRKLVKDQDNNNINDNTNFDVEVSQNNNVLGTFRISQNNTGNVWLASGTYLFCEKNVDTSKYNLVSYPGLSNGCFNFTVGNYPDWTLINKINPITINAKKVICDSESDLPNQTQGAINENTAQNWVDNSDGHCKLETQWSFQWGAADAGSFGDFQTNTDYIDNGNWHNFNVVQPAVISDTNLNGRIEVREVFENNNYVPFTNTTDNVSAEIYCTGDGANYDNWEWINNPQYGQTYYCVAFNALKQAKITVIKQVDTNNDGVVENTNATDWTWDIGDGEQDIATGQSRVLIADTYALTEDQKDDYTLKNWTCSNDTSGTTNSISVNLNPGDDITCTITNVRDTGTLRVNKLTDTNGDGSFETGYDESNTLGFRWGIDLETPQRLMGSEASPLLTGTYNITENDITGYHPVGWFYGNADEGCDDLDGIGFPTGIGVSKDITTYITLCNVRDTGSITVTKFNDLDSDGRFDEDTEEVLPDWTINLSGDTKVTENKGVLYDQLISNTYSLSESLQTGWTQTNIYCNGEEQDREEFLIDNDNSHQISLTAGQNLECYIGNQRLNPKLTISKSNDVSGDKTPGSSVGFKIKITVLNNDIDDLKVTDLLSEGFVYQLGSFKVLNLTTNEVIGITEPVYHSPGIWKIGEVKAGDILELSYLADISSDQQPGTYKDLAYAQGVAAYDNTVDVLATSVDDLSKITDNFVGTEVPIVKSTQNSVSAGVEREVEGQVLGASTELPSTGANTIWLIISALMSLIGLAFIKKSSLKLMTIIFLTAFCFFPINAQAIDNLSVRLEQPKSPTNLNDLKLTFVALDINNNPITVKCFKKSPSDGVYSQFGTDILLAAPGNTSQCQTNSSILNTEGTYNFYVTANGEQSNIISLDYKTSGPGTPSDYRKEWLNNGCDYKIHFKTADDGGKTVKVELYRSDITNFILDDGSRVSSVSIGSNQESTITNTVPDCSKSYYYVLRAFDDAGNGSGTIGDTVTITTTSTTVGTTTTTAGAIPVTNATLSPEEETALLTGTPIASEETVTNNEEGTVLGTVDTVKSFLQKSWLPLALGLIALFAIIRYALRKKRKSYR